MAWLGTTRWTSSVEEQFNLLNHQWIQGTSPGFILLRSEKTKSPIYRVQGQVEHICTTWWRRMVYPDAWRVRKRPYLVHCIVVRTLFSSLPLFTPPFYRLYFPISLIWITILSYLDSVSIVNPKSRRKGIADFPRSFSCSGKILISKWP